MFSDIYLAGHEEMGLECVLKFPRYSVGLELIMTTFESNVSILEEEAEILGWWQDIPNVVRLLDVSFDVESPIVPFIVLEKLGRSLDDEIGRSGIGGSRTMIKSICDIAEALDAIHEEGMAHLDVKPENILFDPTQNAWKLIDPAGHSSMGTESYRARGVTEGWERDILALGRTFLTMYTGSEVEGDYGLDNFDDFYDEYWIDKPGHVAEAVAIGDVVQVDDNALGGRKHHEKIVEQGLAPDGEA